MKRALSIMFATLVLAGCATTSDIPAPRLDMPADFRAEAPAATTALTRDWWRSFESAELAALIDLALRESPDLAMAVERVRQAEAQVRIAVLEITDAPTEIEDLTMDDFPLALILGNEISGVDDDLVREADFALEIPQYGFKQSLNVSVAYGVAVMSLVKHYRRLRGLPVHELLRPSC